MKAPVRILLACAGLIFTALSVGGCSDGNSPGDANCGKLNQPCCGSLATCSDNLGCFSGTCQRVYGCGEVGLPCCAYDTCNGGNLLACHNGTCDGPPVFDMSIPDGGPAPGCANASPGSACLPGTACTIPDRCEQCSPCLFTATQDCSCINGRWSCVHTDGGFPGDPGVFSDGKCTIASSSDGGACTPDLGARD